MFFYRDARWLHLLEEIRFWKEQEREHTVVLREYIPSLESQYVRLLKEWEHVFAKTGAEAKRLLSAVKRTPGQISPAQQTAVHRLYLRSQEESRLFVQQLNTLLSQSKAAGKNAAARILTLHIIKESEYFLRILDQYQSLIPAFGGVHPQAYTHGASAQVPDTQSYEESQSVYQTFGQESPDSYGEQAHISAYAPHNDDSEAAGQEEARQEPAQGMTATNEGTWSERFPDHRVVPVGGHTLPPLPYAYDALEPHIDAETMRVHHDVLHKNYVDNLNKAEVSLAKARASNNFDLVKHWEGELAFNGAGHYLHTIFWNVMSPSGGGKATGPIAAEINSYFGSFDAFKKHFSAAAEKVQGPGWAMLVWSPRSRHLEILQVEKHQNLSQQDIIPLLVLDVWEHSYYIKYHSDRKKYIAAWWNVVNWTHVNERFSTAKNVEWAPY